MAGAHLRSLLVVRLLLLILIVSDANERPRPIDRRTDHCGGYETPLPLALTAAGGGRGKDGVNVASERERDSDCE